MENDSSYKDLFKDMLGIISQLSEEVGRQGSIIIELKQEINELKENKIVKPKPIRRKLST